jgi:hypothetical protein
MFYYVLMRHGRGDILKPAIGNGSLDEDSNDNVDRMVNFKT